MSCLAKNKLTLFLTFVVLFSVLILNLSWITAEELSSAEKSQINKEGIEIALITDVGTLDDKAFNQGAWEGVLKYAEEHGLKVNEDCKYYRPTEQSDASYEHAIALAIEAGAKLVICPGFLFEKAVYKMANEHKEIKFLLLDGLPKDENDEVVEAPLENVIAISYKEEEAGFLAGYAMVVEGYRELAFMGGMAVPPVIRYGYGFIQGADVAARELGLDKDSVNIIYNYVGSFDPLPEIQNTCATWYQNGTEVIFACGGSIGVLAMNAAESQNKKVIGVDIDQYERSTKTVITSAMKNLQLSVYNVIDAYFTKKWKSDNLVLGSKDNMVILNMEHNTFKIFDENKYKDIYKKLQDTLFDIKTEKDAENPDELNIEKVKVDFVE